MIINYIKHGFGTTINGSNININPIESSIGINPIMDERYCIDLELINIYQ